MRSPPGRDPFILKNIAVVELEDERDFAGKIAGAGLEKAEGRGEGIAAAFDRQLEVVMRIVGRRIGRERARRSVLEALIDGQDDQFAGSASRP